MMSVILRPNKKTGLQFCYVSSPIVPLSDQPPYKLRLDFLVGDQQQRPTDPYGFYAEYDVINKTQEERNFTAGIVRYSPPITAKIMSMA